MGEKVEIYIHKHMAICKSVTLIAGTFKAARVHMLSAEETSNTGVLNTWCGKTLNSYTAQVATGDNFIIDLQQPCRNCQKSWPDTITSLFHSIDLEPRRIQTRNRTTSRPSMMACGARRGKQPWTRSDERILFTDKS